MKRLNLIQLTVACLIICSSAFGLNVQNNPIDLQSGNYIVVAAFKSNQEALAEKYAKELTQAGLSANYGFDNTRKLYYVFLAQYSDFTQSVQAMLKVRSEGKFSDAWVRVMKIEGSEPVAVAAPAQKMIKKEESEPLKQETAKVLAEETVTTVAKQENSAALEVKKSVTEEEPVIPNPDPLPVFLPQTLKNTPVFLSLYNPRNGKKVDGKVEVIDTDMNRLLTTVNGNTYVNLPDPKSKSGRLTLVAAPFGYRKIQNIINYKDTEADTLLPYVDLVGNYYMIKFDMVKYHVGDIVTLYNVYFYNDAAVMLPESTYELNNLYQMMQDNPTYKIRLHGHTNGNHRGKITYMGPTKDFFKITSDAKEEIGTAKELSGARAEVIKEWLVSKGISEERMDVKAWGGSRMIHDKHSQHARRNVRVEVEVLQE